PLGIQVTCIEPGPFRTDWAGRSLTQTPNRITDYADTVGVRLANAKKVSGQEAGDPARAAQAIIHISELETAPRHLVLGAFGLTEATKRLAARLAEIEAGRELGLSTDFPAS